MNVGGVWIQPGDLLHGDQHGVVTVPHEVAPEIPAAAAAIEAEERRIIQACRADDFAVERLKALYREIRPGTS